MSDSRFNMLLLDLMDSVSKLEKLLKEYVPKKDFDALKEELQDLEVKIAKIEGLLSARGDVNLSVKADSVETIDQSTTQNITKNGKEK